MGCGQSKIENEDAVNRCKLRKQYMNDAVVTRNAFAAAHSGYALSLKNTGAALSDYSRDEFQDPNAVTAPVPAAAVAPSNYETLRPPPPLPPPELAASPLLRAVSMPEISVHKHKSKLVDPIEEENEEEIEKESHSLKPRSSRRAASGGGSGGNRTDAPGKTVAEEGLTASASPPPLPPQIGRSSPPPPPALPEGTNWGEYIFPSLENVPGSNLADVEEGKIEIERKMYEEQTKRTKVVDGAGDGKTKSSVKVDATGAAEKSAEQPPLPPAAAKVMKKVKHDATTESIKRGGRSGTISTLLQIFNELDDYFLQASQSAHEVTKMLQANRMHYHSNFADNRGHMDHSARIMRAIMWTFKGLNNNEDVEDELDLEEHETHASVLDMMLAWEKKLFDEMKMGEYMKLAYQRKVMSLNRLKKRGASTEAIEKTKAALSKLHTRYIVDIQSTDKTASEINRLRDLQLFPKLVELVDGMATMWETMQKHHESQAKLTTTLRSLDIEPSHKETSDHHHNQTVQLLYIVQMWHSQFENLMAHQKKYIGALNNWVRLNLIHIDNNRAEKVESSPIHQTDEDIKQTYRFGNPQSPRIHALLQAWQDCLERLSSKIASEAISNLAAAINTIVHYQVEELKLRNKCEDLRKELIRRTRQFEEWCNNYTQRKKVDDMDFEKGKFLIAEKQSALEALKHQLEHTEENHRMLCTQVREQSFASLKAELPDFFLAMRDFSRTASVMYRHLWSISQAPEQ